MWYIIYWFTYHVNMAEDMHAWVLMHGFSCHAMTVRVMLHMREQTRPWSMVYMSCHACCVPHDCMKLAWSCMRPWKSPWDPVIVLLENVTARKASNFQQKNQYAGHYISSNTKMVCMQDVWAKKLHTKSNELCYSWNFPPNLITLQWWAPPNRSCC